jgi:hypothetical protein
MDLNVSLAEKRPERNPVPALRQIFIKACIDHGLSVYDVGFANRQAKAVACRNEYFFKALADTRKSTTQIGRLLGTDHTTVMYGSAVYALTHGLPLARGGTPSRVRRILTLKKYRYLQSP